MPKTYTVPANQAWFVREAIEKAVAKIERGDLTAAHRPEWLLDNIEGEVTFTMGEPTAKREVPVTQGLFSLPCPANVGIAEGTP